MCMFFYWPDLEIANIIIHISLTSTHLSVGTYMQGGPARFAHECLAHVAEKRF